MHTAVILVTSSTTVDPAAGPNAARIMPKVHDMWVNSLAALLGALASQRGNRGEPLELLELVSTANCKMKISRLPSCRARACR